MCEFRADHDVNEIWLRILSNNPHVIHRLEIGSERRGKRISVSVIPRNRRLAARLTKEIHLYGIPTYQQRKQESVNTAAFFEDFWFRFASLPGVRTARGCRLDSAYAKTEDKRQSLHR